MKVHYAQDSIGDLAGVAEWKRARQYVQEGRVGKLEQKLHDDCSVIEAEVSGAYDYRTYLRIQGTDLAYVGCDCFRFAKYAPALRVLSISGTATMRRALWKMVPQYHVAGITYDLWPHKQ